MDGITQFVERLFMSPRLRWLKNLFGIHKLYPDGHFHSAIPPAPEFKPVKAAEHYRGIVLNDTVQISFLEALYEHYKDLPQHWLQKLEGYYSYDNAFFSYSDAILLFCIIAHHHVKRIVELGSGYSSLCIVDSLEALKLCTEFKTYDLNDFSGRTAAESDRVQPYFNKKDIRDIPLELFQKMESGDILFVDSSHVSKYASDVNHIFFNILPQLNAGVLIHFHDAFKNFEYPEDWLKEGIYWNEQYLLRAFLQYNDSFEVVLFSDYMEHNYESWYRKHMPLCLELHETYAMGKRKGRKIPYIRGQSIWLKKTK